MEEFPKLKARELELDIGSGHTAYRGVSLINLYLPSNFH